MSNLIKSKSGQLRINQLTSSPFENPHFFIEIRLSKIVTLPHFCFEQSLFIENSQLVGV